LKEYVIITGGGSGSRMNSVIPKQFLEINGSPIIFYAIKAFLLYNPDIKIIITLPENQFKYWEELIFNKKFDINHTLVKGGNTRFHSVKNALQYVPNNSIVAIHDAVRPLASINTITKAFEMAKKFDAAIPTILPCDSIRIKTENLTKAINRSTVMLVQTPQVFISDKIKLAYNIEYSDAFTDDASVYESVKGNTVKTTEGNIENIKITNPIDIIIAEALFRKL